MAGINYLTFLKIDGFLSILVKKTCYYGARENVKTKINPVFIYEYYSFTIFFFGVGLFFECDWMAGISVHPL